MKYCRNCGTEIEEGVNVCPTCGAAQQYDTPETAFCKNCGTEIDSDCLVCPECGQKVGPRIDKGVSKDKKKKNLLIICVVVLAFLLVAVVIGCGQKKNFVDMYGDLAENSWCTIASDGSYMMLDTNPYDYDDDDFIYYYSDYFAAIEAIERINIELGFTEALMKKMDNTTWAQGLRTESNKNYTVSWTYHPDKGLEVIYELN